MNSKVAIVIPTFNRANFVSNAIDSALVQTYPCEVIVCDHGSRDNTPEVMKQYENKIKYIRREKDFGPHFCWLEGVLNADADFIHLQFDDDYIEPIFIEKTLAFMSDPSVGLVFSDVKVLNYNSKEYSYKILNHKDKMRTGIYKNTVLKRMIFSTPSMMISPAACLYRKNEVIDALYQGNLPIDFGGNYHGVGPDILMTLLCLLRFRKFGFVEDELAVFTAHDDSITIGASQDIRKQKKLIRGYMSLKTYYNLISLYKKNWIIRCISAPKMIWYRIKQLIKYCLKFIGLRK
jgi:glycosyltransferase involved in cell wall biosynthesis